jgi:2-phosphosulfolactate phosphatase
VEYLLKLQPETVWIVGSGWEGSYALEDTVCAGAIAHSLQEKLQAKAIDVAGNDETVAAISLYQQWQNDLVGLLRVASHGQRLLRLDCDTDIQYCAALDNIQAIPIRTEPGVFKALT